MHKCFLLLPPSDSNSNNREEIIANHHQYIVHHSITSQYFTITGKSNYSYRNSTVKSINSKREKNASYSIKTCWQEKKQLILSRDLWQISY
mmetsp:Transcript_991/g.1753  ORF Transcript_991/g.1753 Transcript_991/m.1753 type:complete len:91 (+) Transcript_991:3443-3715(+)